jgi:hypothetical protein
MALFRMFVGYLAACLAVVLAPAFAPRIGSLLGLPIAESDNVPEIGLFFWSWGAVAVLSLVPATIAINYGKRNGKRSVGFFAAAGALIGAFWPAFLSAFLLLGAPGLIGKFRDLMIAVGYLGYLGALAGIVYWAIAGRRTCEPASGVGG